MSAYLINVTIHLLAALLWLGGMFFLAAVGAPVLRKVEPPELRSALFQKLGSQFRGVGWVCIGVLLVTGVLNLHFRGVLNGATLGSSEFWATRYGTTLGWKLGAVAAMLVVQAIHDFFTGPAASKLRPGSPEMLKARRHAALLARWSAVFGIIVVIAAVRLARGG
jgi:copper resistance protein D